MLSNAINKDKSFFVLSEKDIRDVLNALLNDKKVSLACAKKVYCVPIEHEGRIVYDHSEEPIPMADNFILYERAGE